MATRLYFPDTLAAPVTPLTADASFDLHVQGTGRALLRVPDASALATTAYTPDAADHIISGACHHRSYVSEPLRAQTFAGNIKGQFQATEPNVFCNQFWRMVVRVISNDGTTERALLLSIDDLTEVATALTNRAIPNTALTGYTCIAGDRLQVEIGCGGTPTAGGGTNGHNISLRWGCSAAGGDLPENDTDTGTTLRPWIEFSGTLDFAPFAVVPQRRRSDEDRPDLDSEAWSLATAPEFRPVIAPPGAAPLPANPVIQRTEGPLAAREDVTAVPQERAGFGPVRHEPSAFSVTPQTIEGWRAGFDTSPEVQAPPGGFGTVRPVPAAATANPVIPFEGGRPELEPPPDVTMSSGGFREVRPAPAAGPEPSSPVISMMASSSSAFGRVEAGEAVRGAGFVGVPPPPEAPPAGPGAWTPGIVVDLWSAYVDLGIPEVPSWYGPVRPSVPDPPPVEPRVIPTIRAELFHVEQDREPAAGFRPVQPKAPEPGPAAHVPNLRAGPLASVSHEVDDGTGLSVVRRFVEFSPYPISYSDYEAWVYFDPLEFDADQTLYLEVILKCAGPGDGTVRVVDDVGTALGYVRTSSPDFVLMRSDPFTIDDATILKAQAGRSPGGGAVTVKAARLVVVLS